MMLKLVNAKTIQSIVLCLSLIFLLSCSTEKVNEPTELEKFKDKVSLKRLWKTSVGTGDDSLMLQLTPVLIDGHIYTIDIEGSLHVIESGQGKTLWSREYDERVSGGLGFDDKHLYYTTFQGQVVGIDRHNGDELWRQTLTSEAVAAPVSNGKLLMVQTIDGSLTAFDTVDGAKVWQHDSLGPILSLRGTATPLVSLKYTITSFANGEMSAFDNQNGAPFWKATLGLPQGRTELERLVDPDGQATLDGDRLYAAAYQGKLVSLDVTTGQEIWSKELSSFNRVAVGFSTVFVTTANGDVVALNQATGSELWRNEALKYRRLSSPTVFGQTVITADFEGYLHVLSVSDGEMLARKLPDSEGVMGNILVSGDIIYVYARSGDIVAYKIYPRFQLSEVFTK